MSVQMILLPLFVQVLLTLCLVFLTAFRRRKALWSGETRWQDIALREPNWPADATRAAYSFSNQFEIPVLFYVLTILALITKQADLLFVLLAWVFVTLRILQAFVHITNNHVPTRGAFFAGSVIVLCIMWGVYIFRILLLP